MFTLLLSYCIVSGAVVYTLIMGSHPFHRNGLVGKFRRVLTNIPTVVGFTTCWIISCGNSVTATKRFESMENGIMNKRHPALQIFYLCLTLPAIYAHWRYVLPGLEEIFPVRVLMARVMSVEVLVSFAMACFADPGTVLSRSQLDAATPAVARANRAANERFPFDGALFSKANNCFTCTVDKPARSKHCPICNRCVRRYDHHCAWLNTDVGENNLRWFHFFLLSHVACALNFTFDAVLVMLEFIDSQRLWDATFVSRNGAEVKAGWQTIALYVVQQMPAVAGVFIFCLLIFAMLLVFWLTHFKQVIRNETTNERYKREDLIAMAERQFEEDEESISRSEARGEGEGAAALTQKKQRLAAHKANVALLKRNPYNRGWWRNILEVVFPVSPVPALVGVDGATDSSHSRAKSRKSR